MKQRVVVDTDFCKLLTEKDGRPTNTILFKNIFIVLELTPVLHEFVYKNELFDNQIIKTLVDENFIELISYNSKDFLSEKWMYDQYKVAFREFYRFMNGTDFPEKNDVFSYRKAKSNLGEIHSLILAQYLGIPIFMSNDKGAKQLATQKINTSSFSIHVENFCDVCCRIKGKGQETALDTKVVRSLLKSRSGWKEAYDAVKIK